MASAKDIDIYETKDYGWKKRPSGISKKEWTQNKLMHYENSSAAAKTFKFNAEQNKIAQDFNARESQLARDWQERMSNTSHQREVKDLKAAGLNPVLSANNGAQSYTTNAASIAGASGKADSDASAIAMYGSGYLSSQATKYSANQSAAAMRYSANMAYAAAQTSAYAQMYSADKAYEASKYNADQHFASTKYSVDYSHEVTLAGLVKEMILGYAQGDENSLGYKILNPVFQKLAEKYPNATLWEWLGHPKGKVVTANNLNSQGYAHVTEALREMSIASTKATQNALIMYLTSTSKNDRDRAMKILMNNRK